MKKLLPFLLALSVLPTALYAAPADDAARISTLERRIADLEARIADLEARIAVLEHNQSARNDNVREVIIEHRTGRNPAYVCSITPFSKTYEATSHNEGLARTQVRRTCQAEQNAIFCADSDIKCLRYD